MRTRIHRNRSTVVLTLLLLASACCQPIATAQAQAGTRPNILFIAVDDWNDWVGCLGNGQAITPNMDRLAARGMLFTNAHCAAPVCNPSRAAVLTGLFPDMTGVYNNSHVLRRKKPDVVTLPQVFRQHGYHVAGGGKIFHDVPPHCHDPASWDEYFWWNEHGPKGGKAGDRWRSPYSIPPDPEPAKRPSKQITAITKRNFDWGPVEQPETDWPDRKVADWAAQFLRAEQTEPFFLAVGIFRPHVPWFNPPKYFDMYPLEDIRLPAVKDDDLEDLGEWARKRALDRSSKHDRVVEFGEWRGAVQAYLASISFSDAMLGRVLDALDAGPNRENTIVVLWSDHGYHLGEKGHWHKQTLWERSTRVPLLAVVPGVTEPGSRCARPVNLVDLYPTLLELTGLPLRQGLAGRSLVPLLKVPDAPRGRPSLTTYAPGSYAVRDERWRYIRYNTGEEELYDMRSDPNEWRNLAAQPSVADHKRRLAHWIDQLTNTKHSEAKMDSQKPNTSPQAAGAPSTITAGEGVPRVVFERGNEFGYRIPALTVSKAGTLLAFCEQRVGGVHDHAQNDIVLRRSADGGQSWGGLQVVHEDGKNVLVNPCVAILDSGRILLMFQRFPAGYHARAGGHMKLLSAGLEGDTISRTLVMHSDDDGVTWSSPRDVTRQTRRPHAISTASGPGVGIVLEHGPKPGRIIMPTNEGWWEGKNRKFQVYACYSDDNGQSWQMGAPAPDSDTGHGNEVQMVELGDGSVLLNSRSHQGKGCRKLAVSTDAGETWSQIRDAEDLPEPRCMGSTILVPGRETDPDMLLFSCPGTKKGRVKGTIRMSRDGGQTWPIARLVEPGAFAYSCLTLLPDGDIGLLYENGYKRIVFKRVKMGDL